jgi:hypothetical protein
MNGIKGLAIGVLLSFVCATGAVAADTDRGSATAPSPSGHEGADLDKSRGSNMGGMQRGEASLKQEQREKEENEANKDKGNIKDPLEKQDPGPGSGRSSGVGAGQ